jgi:hypothetical protein
MKILILLIFLFPLTTLAEIFEVHSIAKNESEKQSWIIKFMNGHVGFWREDDDLKIHPSQLEGSVIDARLSKNHDLTDIRILGSLKRNSKKSPGKALHLPPYTPTIYPNYKDASKALKKMNKHWNDDSQCYDRSHIWSFEEAQKGRFLQKVFMFFSDSYISRYRFGWWFHTAPYALVRFNGEVLEFVMDKYFNKYPIQFKLWTDMFMKNDAQCKVVEKYSGYFNHPGEDDCYLIKSSMYFWQPIDLDAYERSGVEKTKFIDWEIKHAYDNGFNDDDDDWWK